MTLRRPAVPVLSTVLLLAVLGAAPLPGAAAAGAGATTSAGSTASADPGDAVGSTAPAGALPAGGRWTVTLLTGEVVDVRADDEGRVSAMVRESTAPVTTLRLPTGELYVFPKAALPLLDRVLDRALFDVTGLIRQHYDDARSDVVPLIVERAPGTDAPAALGQSRRSVHERPLPSIGAVAFAVPKARAAATGAQIERRTEAVADAGGDATLDDVLQGVDKVWLDHRMTASSASSATSPAAVGQGAPPLDPNLSQIGADDAWAAGLTGDGVRVGVLDTGVDATHPDLAGQIVAQENFSDSEDTVDRVGHGTHVASLIAGTGAAAGGARRGVAPDADLYIGKVLDDFGFGSESGVIAGMEWAASQTEVVNMSLGAQIPDPDHPLNLAVDKLTATYGTLFVIAAGNSGPGSSSVEVPGSADTALTVGAVDGTDTVADFSSRGPVEGSFELKPEVLAPGVDIVAARASGTAMGEPVDDTYTTASGTSMATPQVAGAAALLAGQHPGWAPDDIKETLIGSAAPVGGDGYDVGGGRIAIDRAITTSVHAERDVVETSLPAPRTVAHSETLTWTNTGAAPATLALDAELDDRHGATVDAAAVEPSSLTLAPGATGTATLTVDGPALDDGLYSGEMTATIDGTGGTDGEQVIRTPVAVHAAAETVDVTIRATGPGGPVAPGSVPQALFGIVDLDDYANFHFFGVFGGPWGGEDHWTLPVPKGRYAILGQVDSGDMDNDVMAQAGEPEITIDHDSTVVLDGAAAVPLEPTVTGVDTAPPMYSSAFVAAVPEAGNSGFGLESYAWYPMPPIHVTPMSGDPDQFFAQSIYRLQRQNLTARVGGETVEITAADAFSRLPAGEQVLAAVDAGDGADLSGAGGKLAVVGLPADRAERAAITQRALDAGVALLAFVDEDRPRLTLPGLGFERWAAVPVIAAGGSAATRLRAAGAAGEQVTVTNQPSPYVYDIVGDLTNEVDPDPVIRRSEQRDLARLDERFHRNPDGAGVSGDRRYPVSVSGMNLDSAGPLPERRIAYVTPGVEWLSIALGEAHQAWAGDEPVSIALSMDTGRTYAAGSRTTLRWERPPLRPGPVGIPLGASFCQPLPVARTADTLHVWLAPFQDRPDGFGCTSPDTATMTLERDGVVIGTSEAEFGDFPVPAEAGTYRLSYEQQAEAAPYAHRSSTTWTFRSAAPSGASDAEERIPLLVVDYDLPLDTLNRPTGRTAELRVHQVTGTTDQAVDQLKVWTSTDDGATWRRATVSSTGAHTWKLTLPRVAAGTGVSLKVDATDVAGNRIEQSLLDAYTG